MSDDRDLLAILADGRALTAIELARAAGMAATAVKARLEQWAETGRLTLHRQGPHLYYRLSEPSAAPPANRATAPNLWKGGETLRDARTCYRHFAGRLGIAITDALTKRDYVRLTATEAILTPSGTCFLTAFGVDLDPRGKPATLCRPCLDWSERRPHLTGLAANRLADRCFELGWTTRISGTRAIAVTPKGRAGFADAWGFAPSAGQ